MKNKVNTLFTGVPLLFDLYEGCEKSFDLGPVKVGEKIVRPIEVMNHSKVPIDATFIFKVMYQNAEDNADAKSEGTSVCLSPSGTNTTGQAKDQGPSRLEIYISTLQVVLTVHTFYSLHEFITILIITE